jgi:type IV pilus assembly protein PilN
MRISVNLATRPFVELRPLFARLRLVMAGLALLAVALGITLHTLNKHAQVAEAQMDALKAQTKALEMERATNEARMREPQNRSVLERSQFLNTMFATKSFSWTAVMMDLEGVLPGGVQVTSIEPSITAERDINIRLRVSGLRDLEVDLVRNLEKSQRFLHPRLAAESSQLSEQGKVVQAAQMGVPGGVEFDILSGYIPLPADLMKTPAGGRANEGKPAVASATAGGHRAAQSSAAQSRPATPGTAGTAGAVKKPARTAAPGVIH